MSEQMQTNEDELIRIGDAAKMLGVNPTTLVRWEKLGKIKSVRFEKRSMRRYKLIDIRKIQREGITDAN